MQKYLELNATLFYSTSFIPFSLSAMEDNLRSYEGASRVFTWIASDFLGLVGVKKECHFNGR